MTKDRASPSSKQAKRAGRDVGRSPDAGAYVLSPVGLTRTVVTVQSATGKVLAVRRVPAHVKRVEQLIRTGKVESVSALAVRRYFRFKVSSPVSVAPVVPSLPPRPRPPKQP